MFGGEFPNRFVYSIGGEDIGIGGGAGDELECRPVPAVLETERERERGVESAGSGVDLDGIKNKKVKKEFVGSYPVLLRYLHQQYGPLQEATLPMFGKNRVLYHLGDVGRGGVNLNDTRV